MKTHTRNHCGEQEEWMHGTADQLQMDTD